MSFASSTIMNIAQHAGHHRATYIITASIMAGARRTSTRYSVAAQAQNTYAQHKPREMFLLNRRRRRVYLFVFWRIE